MNKETILYLSENYQRHAGLYIELRKNSNYSVNAVHVFSCICFKKNIC